MRSIENGTPEQVFWASGVVSSGTGSKVTAICEVGPGIVLQFVLVPNTVTLPEVALASKFSVTEGVVVVLEGLKVPPVPV